MELSDIYPTFEIKDVWNRVVRVTANQSLYIAEQKTLVTQGNRYPAAKPISRQQFAMLLLLKVEELAGEAGIFNQDDPANDPPPETPTLTDWFGPKKEREPRRKSKPGNGE